MILAAGELPQVSHLAAIGWPAKIWSSFRMIFTIAGLTETRETNQIGRSRKKINKWLNGIGDALYLEIDSVSLRDIVCYVSLFDSADASGSWYEKAAKDSRVVV